MRIRDLLKAKGSFVASVPPGTTVAEVLAHLSDHGIGALVVSGDGQAISGIVSERDIVRRLHHAGPAILGEPVETLMTVDVHTCTPEDVTDQLAALMTDQRVRHVPVIDGGRLVGIVSIGDVVKARIAELEKDYGHLYEYLTAGR